MPVFQLSNASTDCRLAACWLPVRCAFRKTISHSSNLVFAIFVGLSPVWLSGISSANSIEVVVNEVNGELYLKNSGASSEVIDGYEINSLSGALSPGALTSITTNYDLSGDMSVDSISEWFVLAATAHSVTEVSLTTSSGLLSAGGIVSLGELWDFGAASDLTAAISAGGSSATTTDDYRDLTADYDNNLIVDQLDYDVFVTTYGSTVDLRADGNNDGVVDAADYTVWRDSNDLILALSAINSASSFTNGSVLNVTLAVAVPEPGSLLIVVIGFYSVASHHLRRIV